MEAKLKEYRALRRRRELIDNAKEKYENTKEKLINFIVPKVIQDMAKGHEDEEPLLMEDEEPPLQSQPKQNPIQPIEEVSDIVSETSEVESFEENDEPWRFCLMRWGFYAIIWMGFWAIFLHLQFGAVYFVISVLIGIYLNTRTRPRKNGEVSAYSVFNANCAAIDGTLKPEQFEREIRYGAGTVRHY